MDETRFDTLTRILGDAASRREAFRVAMGGSLAAALAAFGLGDAGAKKKGKNKKKCKKPKVKCKKKCCAAGQACVGGKCTSSATCAFAKTATLWTLQNDCTTKETIAIPDGVTLEGNGKTIKLLSSQQFTGTGIIAQSGNASVRNLTIDGDALACDDLASAMALFNSSGTIEDVTIQNIPCSRGLIIDSDGGPERTVEITNLTIRRALPLDLFPLPVIEIDGDVVVTIAESTLEEVPIGVLIRSGEVTLEDSSLSGFADVFDPFIELRSGGTATIRRNTIEAPAAIVVSGNTAVATVIDNTITGIGATDDLLHGVSYDSGASGTVDGNTISNYLSDLPGQVSCGIFVAGDAGDVTIGTNTFPDPPGNDQDVCDFS